MEMEMKGRSQNELNIGTSPIKKNMNKMKMKGGG